MKTSILSFAIKLLFSSLDKNPHAPRAQYRFNRFFAFIWLSIGIAVATIPSFNAHSLDILVIEEATVWCCFIEHLNAMNEALAHLRKKRPQVWRYEGRS